MLKFISLLFISSFAFAQPTSIHYSGLGDYLVDQDGNKTTIQGHPWMVCYQGSHILKGWFMSAEGATIFLRTDGGNSHIIEKPVCDIK
jgi:hypothetical protein